ncbi:MAG TPA: hypothetical protein PKN82_14905, partial [Thauera sp.]|nr:hypothetical protein [Thauera sp.]
TGKANDDHLIFLIGRCEKRRIIWERSRKSKDLRVFPSAVHGLAACSMVVLSVRAAIPQAARMQVEPVD